MENIFYSPDSLQPTTSASFEDDDSRWQAVQERNIRADGMFVTAVRSTKVYCRPVCKSRHPRRCNVLFFVTGQQAQLAGFRPCKRCKPELDGCMPEDSAVQKIRELLQEWERAAVSNTGPSQLSLSQMAKQANVSKWYFHRVFKKFVGVTPVQYLRMCRNTVQGQNQDMNWLDELADGPVDWLHLTDKFADMENPATENSFKIPDEGSLAVGGDFYFHN
ncbi:AraC family transcriptional regulator [Trichoderma harzianum]|uniref:AraC family transcriptional regulator n=1 Tax=Trichoderma harzianum TaxID=5544 RepID=A0A0F9ZQG9_TRIHA|nr:AraC family transcriptional regulator [Trichoderma harzianum]